VRLLLFLEEGGIWDGGLDSILIVEEIGSQKAKVIYSWGDDVTFGIKKGYRRYIAKVTPGPPAQIEFGGGGYAKLSFEMGKDLNSIRGLWESASGGGYARVVMKRIAK